jgi:hypothetical protein
VWSTSRVVVFSASLSSCLRLPFAALGLSEQCPAGYHFLEMDPTGVIGSVAFSPEWQTPCL